MTTVLDKIHTPRDLNKLSGSELQILTDDIRTRLLNVTEKNGGHLASNLGVVELTIALHRVFNSPVDKILFDVSHQSYVHKLLTGRSDAKFDALRHTDGYSGFFNPAESDHDVFIAGHGGTALSAALGFCIARDRLNQNYNVVAVLGDGVLTCGPTMEALNNISMSTKHLIIILNDNGYSIDRNIGATAIYLNKIIKSKLYESVTRHITYILSKKQIGIRLCAICKKLKFALKDLLLSSSFFEHYGLRYLGPIDGHNIKQIEEYLTLCKCAKYPILLHIKTIKGYGSFSAIEHPDKFHRISPITYESKFSMRDEFGKAILELAKKNPKLIGITAAMAKGTGLSYLRDNLPTQFIDVGIAEEHAVTMCAGLAKAGMKPICAIYSTFMQRAFDQILHDICLQNLPVIFCLDRAGLSANDGPTHHGLFDISFISCLPNTIIMQPKNTSELILMLQASIQYNQPVFIRYNSSYDYNENEINENINFGCSEILQKGEKICLIGLGCFVEISKQVANFLDEECGIVNARFIKPLDRKLLSEIAHKYHLIVTLEDNVCTGGFGSQILEFYNDYKINTPVLRVGWPDKFIEHGTHPDILRKKYCLDAQSIARKIKNTLNRKS